MCVLLFINQADDAQPSDSPDEQPMTGFGMQRPLAIAPIVPGQTVHAHASDKPKRPSYPTSDVSPADMALKVQLKAHREHQIKLKVRYNGTAFNIFTGGQRYRCKVCRVLAISYAELFKAGLRFRAEKCNERA